MTRFPCVALLLVGTCACSTSSPQVTLRPARVVPTSVTIGESVSNPPQPVGPEAGDPIWPVERDGGVSIALRDGSTAWFFGDTGQPDGQGNLLQFRIGSAAWAPPGDPTRTVDHTDGRSPVAFATPTADFPACPSETPAAGFWPLAAIVVPDGSRDRVLLWMANVCLGTNAKAVDQGVALGEWRYDPSRTSARDPIVVNVVNPTLFPAGSVGWAAVGAVGWTYVYGCSDRDGADGPPTGTCSVARVRPTLVADPSAYFYWTGRGWSAIGNPAPMVFHDRGGMFVPIGPFSVVRDEATGLFVMVYSPWPAYSGHVAIRYARAPHGPWSEAHVIALPGCVDQVGPKVRGCYGAAAQPSLSRPGHIAIGYYDQYFAADPPRGSYMLTSIDFGDSS